MGASPPFMYGAERGHNAAFPSTTFDPKAVTRASWEPKPRKPAQTGPLLTFNKHPDAHALLSHQKSLRTPLGGRTKRCIKWLRGVQLFCRVLELNGALGLLVLLILITNIDEIRGWIMRILPSVSIVHCLYAIYHLSRRASGRTPGSSSAYHVFASVFDLVIMSLYTFGAFSTYREASRWSSRLENQSLMHYFVPAIYYMTVTVGGLHLVSLSISLWLGIMFRRISLMPPDMNPLEDNLTARPFHKRNKSSVTTASSIFEEKRQSIPTEHRTTLGLETKSHPQAPVVPFLHTRAGPGTSVPSTASFVDLPSRRYQILPENSPRSSTHSATNTHYLGSVASRLGSYTAISTADSQSSQQQYSNHRAQQARSGKFTETWIPTDSLVSRTNQRNYLMAHPVTAPGRRNRSRNDYDTLAQAPKCEDFTDDSDYDSEDSGAYDRPGSQRVVSKHPNPLGSNPTDELGMKTNATAGQIMKTSRKRMFLSGMSGTLRKTSNSQDITDQSGGTQSPWKRQRDGSIQLDDGFYSKSYGDLRSATPPIKVGGDRKVSSGIDYGMGYRRNASGKVTEEGR